MNANEVIARLASRQSRSRDPSQRPRQLRTEQQRRGARPRSTSPALLEIERAAGSGAPAPEAGARCQGAGFDDIIKSGRTHMMDATPIRLGQEFSGYASMVEHGDRPASRRRSRICASWRPAAPRSAPGSTPHPEFGRRIAAEIGRRAGTAFVEARNHFEAQGTQDAALWASGALNSVAASLMKIASDLRLMNSGPRCGIAEIALPAVQPGSSIMPGKVNPVICEAMIQVGAQVMGNHVAITVGVQGGQLDLNTMLPLIARNLLESIRLLARAARVFADKAVAGPDRERRHLPRATSRSRRAWPPH